MIPLFDVRSLISTAAAACMSLLPLSAGADVLANGSFGIELARNSETLINTKHVDISLAGKVWKDIGLQFDASLGKHEKYTSTAPGATLHAFFEAAPDLSYGIFVAAEDRRPGNSYFYGIEAAWETPGYDFQAFAATREDISAETSGYRLGGDVSVQVLTVPWLSVQAGGTYDNGLPLERSFAYIGAAAEVKDGVSLGAQLGQTNRNATILGVFARIDFGSGPVFGARDTFSRYPGY